MPFDDSDWIALNLPKTANFSKNGVVRTIGDAIGDALAYTALDGQNRKEFALAMLLRILAVNHPFKSFQIGPVAYSGQQLRSLADEWEMKWNGLQPNTIVSVPVKQHDECRDEFGGCFDHHDGCW